MLDKSFGKVGKLLKTPFDQSLRPLPSSKKSAAEDVELNFLPNGKHKLVVIPDSVGNTIHRQLFLVPGWWPFGKFGLPFGLICSRAFTGISWV